MNLEVFGIGSHPDPGRWHTRSESNCLVAMVTESRRIEKEERVSDRPIAITAHLQYGNGRRRTSGRGIVMADTLGRFQ